MIGRSPDADIVVPDAEVSREHARVTELDPNHLEVRDLNSRNGVQIGQERVTSGKLSSGDSFLVGRTLVRWLE